MKDKITYYGKTIKSTNESIKNTEATLRNLTENQELLNIDKVLKNKGRSCQTPAATTEIKKVQQSKI